jgi:ABC-type Fe3+-siderophore transport system permease subunit
MKTKDYYTLGFAVMLSGSIFLLVVATVFRQKLSFEQEIMLSIVTLIIVAIGFIIIQLPRRKSKYPFRRTIAVGQIT